MSIFVVSVDLAASPGAQHDLFKAWRLMSFLLFRNSSNLLRADLREKISFLLIH